MDKKQSRDTICIQGRMAAEKRRAEGAPYLSEHYF